MPIVVPLRLAVQLLHRLSSKVVDHRKRVLSCVVLIAYAGCEGTGDTPVGLIVRGSPVHNFGRCQQGDELTHTFTLVNRTSTPIKVVRLNSSCGCLVASDVDGFVKASIPCDAEVTLPIQFTVGGSQDTATARVDVFYQPAGDAVESNSSGQMKLERLSLLVQADVIPDYRISPSKIDFGVIDGFETRQISRTIHITPEALDQVRIRDVRPSVGLLTARVLPGGSDAEGYEIKVCLNFSKLNQSQTVDCSLVLETDSTRLPSVLVPVHAEYRSPVSIAPESIVVGSDEVGEVKKEICIVTSRRSQIREVRSESTTLRIDCDRDQQSQRHSLQLWVPPCDSEPLDTEVKLEVEILSDASKRTVRSVSVPVYRFFWN